MPIPAFSHLHHLTLWSTLAFLHPALQGSSAELRELAAEGLGELVEVTGEDALKPFVVQVTHH